MASTTSSVESNDYATETEHDSVANTETTAQDTCSCLWLVPFLIAVVAAAVAWIFVNPTTESIDGNQHVEFEKFEYPPGMLSRHILVMNWDHTDPKFSQKIASLGEPVLLKNSPCTTRWSALRGLSPWPSSLRSLPDHHQADAAMKSLLINAKSNVDPLFCPLKLTESQVPSTTSRRDTYSLHNMTLELFLSAATHDEAASLPESLADRFLYFAGPPPKLLASHLQPFDFLQVSLPRGQAVWDHDEHTPAEEAILQAKQTTTHQSAQSMWMAEQGVLANMHYDRSHNFVTQISGAKTWTIFPPWLAPLMYVYPSVHPHYQSTQIDLMNPAALEYFGAFRYAHGVQIEALPGDVLYVPPYWFHAVNHNEGLSVASSVLSPSFHELRCSALKWVPVPFRNTWPLSTRAHVILLFLDALLQRYYDVTQTKVTATKQWPLIHFVHRVMRTRFQALLSDLLSFATPEMNRIIREGQCQFGYAYDEAEGRTVPVGVVREFEQSIQHILDILIQLRTRDASTFASSSFVQYLSRHREILKQQQNHKHQHVPSTEEHMFAWEADELWASAVTGFGVADICLADYIEHQITWAVGPNNIAAFVQFCFTSRPLLQQTTDAV